MSISKKIILATLFAFCQVTFAESIRVDKQQWDALSPGERAAIQQNLVDSLLLPPGVTIEGVEGMGSVGAWDPGCDLKRAACDVAAAAAIANCTGAPPVVAICTAAVLAARDRCRRC